MSESKHVAAMVWLDKWAGTSAYIHFKPAPGKPSPDELQELLFPVDSTKFRRDYCAGWIKNNRRVYPSLCAMFCRAFQYHHLGWFKDQLPYEQQIGQITGLLEGEARRRGRFLEGAKLKAHYSAFFKDPEQEQPFNVGDVLKIGSDGAEHYMVFRGYTENNHLWTVDNGQGQGLETLDRYRAARKSGSNVALYDAAPTGQVLARHRLLTGVIPFE